MIYKENLTSSQGEPKEIIPHIRTSFDVYSELTYVVMHEQRIDNE